MYITNTILYIVKKRELRETAPEGCCLTLNKPLNWYTALRVTSILEYTLYPELTPYHNEITKTSVVDFY